MEIYKLTRATQSQLSQMRALELAGNPEPYTEEMLRDCVENLVTFACMDGEEVAGFLTMNFSRRYFGGSLYIVNLNVAEKHRGQGIAKRLMYAAYEYYAPDCGGKLVSLDVDRQNPAVKLYETVGFQVAEEATKNHGDCLVMAVPFEIWGERLRHLLSV